jgi:hypothetical protein
MNLFCLLWPPALYLFWLSLRPPELKRPAGTFEIGALLLGSAAALIRFISGPWVYPGEFGLSRWLSALVDTAGLPSLLPILVFTLSSAFNALLPSRDLTGFALLWLIPEGILRSLSRAGRRDPLNLVLVPLLWTSLALGIPFAARLFHHGRLRVFRAILGTLIIAALPAAAVTCYWAFFCHRSLWGWLSLAMTLMPQVLALAFSLLRVCKDKLPAARCGEPLSLH